MVSFMKKAQFRANVKKYGNMVNEMNAKHQQYRKLRWDKHLDQDETEQEVFDQFIGVIKQVWNSNLSFSEKGNQVTKCYNCYIENINECIERVKEGKEEQ